MSRTWFITGAAHGFGREWAEAALARATWRGWEPVSIAAFG